MNNKIFLLVFFKMLKFRVVLFAVFILAVHGFHYLDFQRKYCHEPQETIVVLKPTVNLPLPIFMLHYAFLSIYLNYFSKSVEQSKQIVCENFELSEKDLDYLSKFIINTFIDKEIVYLRNCKIDYFNEYIISKFPQVEVLILKNCTISLKNPSVITDSRVSSLKFIIFQDCIINDNLHSKALQKLPKLFGIIIEGSTFQYPTIDKYLLPETSDIVLICDKVNLKSFDKDIRLKDFICTSCEFEDIDSLFYGSHSSSRISISFKNNLLKKMPSFDILKNYSNLQGIDLSQNLIEDDLKRNNFKILEKLEFLDLSQNFNITGMDYLVFNGSELKALNLSNVNLKELKKLGSRQLQILDLSKNSISSFMLDTFKDLFDLTFLDLSENSIQSIENGSFKDLKDLKELKLSKNTLENINADDLKNLHNLRKLYLSYNKLKSIIGIAELEHLEEIYLQHNFLDLIPLLPRSLKILDISGNPFIYVMCDFFTKTPALVSLDMSYTNHSNIVLDKHFLRDVKGLKILRMEGNNITSLDQIYLPNTLESLESLSLKYNEILKVEINNFQQIHTFEYLKFLDFSENNIYLIENGVLKVFRNLEDLRLNGNSLEHINFLDLSQLQNLQRLYLNSNKFKIISGFGTMEKLQELYLQDNFLKIIPSIPSSLKILDISENPLHFVTGAIFEKNSNLSYLDLSYTNKTYIDFDKYFLKDLKNITILKMKGNNISSLEQIYLPSSLEVLSLEYNEIVKVDQKDLENLEKLKNLNISNNLLKDFEKDITKNLKNLKEIDISGNNL